MINRFMTNLENNLPSVDFNKLMEAYNTLADKHEIVRLTTIDSSERRHVFEVPKQKIIFVRHQDR
jgi:hypothetical protein